MNDGTAEQPPVADASALGNEFSLRSLRQRAALNLFKEVLLEEDHVPNDPQTSAVMHALERLDEMDVVGSKTWEGWFSTRPRVTQRKKFEQFDRLRLRLPASRRLTALHPRFFLELGCGGLLASLFAPTTSTQPRHVLAGRAIDYVPVCALHLHLDAIELAALTVGFKSISWEEVTDVAARRLMDALHVRWTPRGGTIYKTFTSDLALRCMSSTEEQRQEIREEYRRWKPDLFDEHLQNSAWPRWERIGLPADTPPAYAHRLLLGLAADHEFLTADRFESWVLDLATSAIAMYALAWTDRYRTFGARVSEEMVYWRAFDSLLFDSSDDDHDEYIVAALDVSGASWSDASVTTLRRARDFYGSLLQRLGTNRSEVSQLIENSARVHRLLYKG